jgi:hypothetical protein
MDGDRRWGRVYKEETRRWRGKEGLTNRIRLSLARPRRFARWMMDGGWCVGGKDRDSEGFSRRKRESFVLVFGQCAMERVMRFGAGPLLLPYPVFFFVFLFHGCHGSPRCRGSSRRHFCLVFCWRSLLPCTCVTAHSHLGMCLCVCVCVCVWVREIEGEKR